MKKVTRILTLLAVVSLSAFTKAKAQVDIGVNLQLNRPAEYERNERVHPPRPSANHIWVAEEWTTVGGKYVYAPGHWVLPPRRGAYWIKGYWQHRRRGGRGYFWVPGHWSGQ